MPGVNFGAGDGWQGRNSPAGSPPEIVFAVAREKVIGSMVDMSLRFLLRAVSVMSGLLLLMACAYLGVGWAVLRKHTWVIRTVGDDRWFQLLEGYTGTLNAVFPNDVDGDGISDGREIAAGSDPRIPTDQTFLFYPQGVQFYAHDSSAVGLEGHSQSRKMQILSPGERRTVSLRVQGLSTGPVFPKGFKVRIQPSSSSLVARNEGVPAATPIVVPVSTDGEFQFSLQAQAGAIEKHDYMMGGEEYLQVDNATTGQEVGQIPFRRAWRSQAIIPKVEPLQRSEATLVLRDQNIVVVERWNDFRTVRVSWPLLGESFSSYLLEAAGEEERAPWSQVEVYDDAQTSRIICQYLTFDQFPYRGPLKFRITPLSTERIAEQTAR